MFTGIIETVGAVTEAARNAKGLRLEVRPAKPFKSVALGESIAVNGVCLTVTARTPQKISFDVIRQTLRVTTLGALKAGDAVNLERALRHGDRVSGHYVLGHVEAKAKVQKVLKTKNETEIRIALPAKAAKGIVLKGCVAVDGVSLTVSRRAPKAFSVHVIPHTWSVTSLKFLKAGDFVNLEGDFLLKPKRRRSGRVKKLF